MKSPVVFSLVRSQSIFMTAIMSLLTFLAVLAFGICLSIGTGVMRWNTQWDLFATVQVMDTDKAGTVKNIIKENKAKTVSVTEITPDQMANLMRPWLSSGDDALKNYLPQMYEIQFKTKSDLDAFGRLIGDNARFLSHSAALKNSTAAGWYMIMISALVLAMVLGAIGVCISYIARNTALLHKRELEILNQIGATDSFVARQMQIIVTKISATAGLAGFCAAVLVLLMILGAAHGARVGLMAMMGLSGAGWITLALLPVAIVIFAIYITRRTTLKILAND